MKTPIKAYGGNGKSVIYEFSDGSAEMRNSGTIAWRSTNPGNLISGSFSKRQGSIGNNGPFAVFPDYGKARMAIYRLLSIKKYNNVSLAEAIYFYAPPKHNNTEAYIKHVVQLTGIHRYRMMSDLSFEERWSIVEAIILHEEYRVGIIKPIKFLKKSYRWRTQKDEDVRPEHAKREGEIRSWDDPYFDGHPGDAYGCRCWAEAFEYDRVEKQLIVSPPATIVYPGRCLSIKL